MIRQFVPMACLLCLIIGINNIYAEEIVPLTEMNIENAITASDLDFVLSDLNTQEKEHHSFILRDKHKKYAMSPDKVIRGIITSSVFENKRYLEVTFYSDPDQYAELPLKWEEWKKQVKFTSEIWGLFSEPEALYNSLAGLETGGTNELFTYNGPVEQSYLEIRYSMLPTAFTNEEIIDRSLMLTLRLYEDPLLYADIMNQLKKGSPISNSN